MPLSIPCGNYPCPNYVDRLGDVCSQCKPRPVCPRCGGHIEDIAIDGKSYRVKKRGQVKRPYQWVSDDEVLYFRAVPLLIVETKN